MKLSVCPKTPILLFFWSFWPRLDKIRPSPTSGGLNLIPSDVILIVLKGEVGKVSGLFDIAISVFPSPWVFKST